MSRANPYAPVDIVDSLDQVSRVHARSTGFRQHWGQEVYIRARSIAPVSHQHVFGTLLDCFGKRIKEGRLTRIVDADRVLTNDEVAGLRDLGIDMDVIPHGRTATQVLQHACRSFEQLRSQLGANLFVFKIGITSDPLYRAESYFAENFSMFRVVWASNKAMAVEFLEAVLISKYGHLPGCRNTSRGGRVLCTGTLPPTSHMLQAHVLIAESLLVDRKQVPSSCFTVCRAGT